MNDRCRQTVFKLIFLEFRIEELVMKNYMSAVAAVGALLSFSPVYADSKARPVYNYAGAKLVSQSVDVGGSEDCRQNGIYIEGSYDVDGQLFVRGSFGDVSGDDCGSRSATAEIGYRTAWGEASHLYATGGVETIAPDVGSRDTGLVLAGGIRSYIVPGIEAYAELQYHSVNDDGAYLGAGAAYWFNDSVAITGDVTVGSENTAFGVGARVSF